jgi:tetratricopeptide (TPR) repeat protein
VTGRLLAVTGALVVLAGACSRQAPSTSPGLIALPDLSSFEGSVQRQIRNRHTVLDVKLQNPATPQSDLAAAYGDLARLLMAVGMNDLAVSGYLHAEARAPTEMRWSYYLGHAYLRSGERSRAAAAFQQASRLSPADPRPLIWLGATCLDDGRPEEARAAFSRALALGPQLAAAWFGAGRAALALKAYTEAATDFERVLAIDGRASAVHYPLGIAYRALGDPQKAAAHLRQRGDVTPELDDPLMQSDDDVLESSVGSEHRGMQALKRGDWRVAIAEFRKGLELKPDDVTLRYWLGAALYASGDGLAAEREFRAVVQRAPDNADIADNANRANAHFSLGAIEDAKGRRREAIEEYSAAVKADPTLPAARLRLAAALRTSGQPEASLAQYQRAVDLDPRLVDAWIGGAQILIGLARYDRARDWLLRARDVHPERNELAELEARLPRPHR